MADDSGTEASQAEQQGEQEEEGQRRLGRQSADELESDQGSPGAKAQPQGSVWEAEGPGRKPWQRRLYLITFKANTRIGRLFDLGLLLTILLSVALVMLDSVRGIHDRYQTWLIAGEWVITICFTIEYILRLICLRNPLRYAISFFGIVDLLSILPTYLSLLIPGSQNLTVIRALRLLRIFRILKLARFVGSSRILITAMRASLPKIIVFLGTVLILVTILGATMYLIERGEPGSRFTSIPMGVYWAVVTLTTVGYGDVIPVTDVGKALSTVVMIMGYGIIAVPTGIVSVELANAHNEPSHAGCTRCGEQAHPPGARFCHRCGDQLPTPMPE